MHAELASHFSTCMLFCAFPAVLLNRDVGSHNQPKTAFQSESFSLTYNQIILRLVAAPIFTSIF